MRPRPCVAMKLTASGVTNCAAIVRSPSFSRSASSQTTTKRPARISSIASSMLANGDVSVGRGLGHDRIVAVAVVQSSVEQPLDVLGEHVDLEVHLAAGLEVAERRLGERVRDQRDGEAVAVERRDRQRDALDRDRALLDAVAQQLGQAPRRRTRTPSPSGSTARTRADAVDVALHVVAARAARRRAAPARG